MKSLKGLAAAASILAMSASISTPAQAQLNPFIGQWMYTAATFCPRGWATASGQLLPINQYQALFSLYGTTWGGDGRTTFGLPDLRGRRAIGFGTMLGGSTYAWGQRGGAENVVLTTSQLPVHTHGIAPVTPIRLPTSSQLPDTTSPDGASPPTYPAAQKGYKTGIGDQAGMDLIETVQLGLTGGNLSHENRSPYLTVQACVSLQGIFPSRN